MASSLPRPPCQILTIFKQQLDNLSHQNPKITKKCQHKQSSKQPRHSLFEQHPLMFLLSKCLSLIKITNLNLMDSHQHSNFHYLRNLL
jgi:hypothetical protein